MAVTLDPDPQKIEKEGLVNWAGWKCTLWNVRNFTNIIVEITIASRASEKLDTRRSFLILPAWFYSFLAKREDIRLPCG